MSYQAVKFVLDHADVDSPVELAVLVAFAERADDLGQNSYPGPTEIARRARISVDYAKKVTRRLRNAGRLLASHELSEHGTRIYAIAGMQGIGSRGDNGHPVPIRPGVQGNPGFLGAERGVVESPAGGVDRTPKPPMNHQRNRPRARAGARRAPHLQALSADAEIAELAEEIFGRLDRALDSLTTDEPMKRPTRAEVLGVLRRCQPSRNEAIAAAVATRAIVQGVDRAPNIVGLLAQQLSKASTSSSVIAA